MLIAIWHLKKVPQPNICSADSARLAGAASVLYCAIRLFLLTLCSIRFDQFAIRRPYNPPWYRASSRFLLTPILTPFVATHVTGLRLRPLLLRENRSSETPF